MSRVPASADADTQQAFREIWAAIDRLGKSQALNLDLAGRRIINAGDAVQQTDYVTKRQLDSAAGNQSPSTNGDFVNLRVKALTQLLGPILLPQFTDGTAHHAILFVDENGNLAVNGDGAAALDLNISGGFLELGFGLIIKWLNQAEMGSPAIDVINVMDHLGGTSILRFVIGLDDATGISLTKNGTTLEVRVGGGGALTALTVAALTAAAITAASLAATGAVSGATLTATGLVTGGSFKVGADAGVDFSGPITNVTFKKGIATAAS